MNEMIKSAEKMFNTVVNEDVFASVGMTRKHLETLKKFDVSNITENGVSLKSVLAIRELDLRNDANEAKKKELENSLEKIELSLSKLNAEKKAIVGVENPMKEVKIKGITTKVSYSYLLNELLEKRGKVINKITSLEEAIDAFETLIGGLEEFYYIATHEFSTNEETLLKILQYHIFNSKALDITKSFTDIATACDTYNWESITQQNTKDSYVAMKNAFKGFFDCVKITTDMESSLFKNKTVSLNQEELKLVSKILFSSAKIGKFESDGKQTVCLTTSGKAILLENAVGLLLMKLQGVKVDVENIHKI